MTLDAEKALVGALIMDPRAVAKCGSLAPDMFTDALLGRIYLEYARAYDFGYSANLVTIAENLLDVSKTELLETLKECSDSTITSEAAGKYADAIVGAYKARRASQIVNSMEFQSADVERQIGQLVNDLDALRGGGRTCAKNLAQIIDEVSSGYFTDSERPRLYTGFTQLDECLGGLEGGDVIVVGARPAVGKSAFVSQMALNMGKAGKRVLLFNLEMKEAQVYERMVSSQSGITLDRIRRGKQFLGNEKARFDSANEGLKKLDIWISSGSKSVSEIRNECRHMGADVIVIDYLQLIKPDRKYSNRVSEVGDISKSIKALAMELNCPIVVLSQLNRVSESRETKEPTMSELRESGDIEQDASIVALFWNANDTDRSKKILKVEKNRHGKQGKIYLQFDGCLMNFMEVVAPGEGFIQVKRNSTPFD